MCSTPCQVRGFESDTSGGRKGRFTLRHRHEPPKLSGSRVRHTTEKGSGVSTREEELQSCRRSRAYQTPSDELRVDICRTAHRDRIERLGDKQRSVRHTVPGLFPTRGCLLVDMCHRSKAARAKPCAIRAHPMCTGDQKTWRASPSHKAPNKETLQTCVQGVCYSKSNYYGHTSVRTHARTHAHMHAPHVDTHLSGSTYAANANVEFFRTVGRSLYEPIRNVLAKPNSPHPAMTCSRSGALETRLNPVSMPHDRSANL